MNTLREDIAARRATQAAESSIVVGSDPVSALVVSTWQGGIWVLPWPMLVSAHFHGQVRDTRLDLAFLHNRVVAHGRQLRGLAEGVASFRLSALREFPPDYRPPGDASAPFVARIEVRAFGASVPDRGISDPSH